MLRGGSVAIAGLTGVARTARWTAASRARESRRPDRLFSDPLAEVLAGEEGASLLTHFHTPHAADTGNPFLPIRTRWFDDYLAETVNPGSQVISLGAGLDTRAYRLDWPDGVRLFEVDHPALLFGKREALALAGATTRCDTREVPADLAGNWAAKLRAAGFRPGTRTVWFAEGLLFYLPESLARDVLTTATGLSGPGSRLAADLIGTGIFRFSYMREFLRRLEAADSPWVFGTDDPSGFIESCGWHVLAADEPGHPTANYGRWPEHAAPSTFPNLPRSYFISAAIPAGGGRGGVVFAAAGAGRRAFSLRRERALLLLGRPFDGLRVGEPRLVGDRGAHRFAVRDGGPPAAAGPGARDRAGVLRTGQVDTGGRHQHRAEPARLDLR